MAQTYQVGDTQYQFPDNYSDDQVHGILMKQGVVKPDVPKPPLTEGLQSAKPGFFPTLGRDLMNAPGQMWRSVTYPSTDFGTGSSVPIGQEDRATALRDLVSRQSGNPQAGRTMRAPDDGYNPGAGETAAHVVSPYVIGAGLSALAGGVGAAAGPMSRFLNAASDPAVRDALLPGPVKNAATEFGSAYRRAGATATPDTPFSVANDPRPLNGPVVPPPRVIRDPGQGGVPPTTPVDAARPGAFTPPRFTPPAPQTPATGVTLPSGKTVGGIQNQTTSVAPPPVEPSPTLPSGWSGTVPGNIVPGKTMRGAPPVPPEPVSTVGTQAEMMRQQRLRDAVNTANVAPPPVIFDANGNPINRGGQ